MPGGAASSPRRRTSLWMLCQRSVMVSATRGQEYPCAKPLATFQIHCTASAVFWGNRSLAASSDAGRSCWANAAAIIIPTIGPFFEIIVSGDLLLQPKVVSILCNGSLHPRCCIAQRVQVRELAAALARANADGGRRRTGPRR